MCDRRNPIEEKTMTPEKLKRLHEAGFVSGDAKDLLGLTPDEAKLVELRVEIAKAFRTVRRDAGMTQAELARRIGSSQSRIAAAEHGIDAGIDLLIRCLYAVGGELRTVVPATTKKVALRKAKKANGSEMPKASRAKRRVGQVLR